MERIEANREGKIYHTCEMVDYLQQKTGLQELLCEAVLSAWVGAIRTFVLSHAEKDPIRVLPLLKASRVCLCFSGAMQVAALFGLFLALIKEEAGCSAQNVVRVLDSLGEKLNMLKGEKAFEPIGWIEESFGAICAIRLWNDFLQPMSDDPVEFITG